MGWYRIDLAGTRVAFTDRRGGVSAAPFDALNLDDRADDPAAVAANRRVAARVLGPGLDDPAAWVPLRQVHGAGVVVCGPEPPGAAADADAVVVAEPGPVAVILTADCAPLALVGPGAAAAVHVGWRGLVAGVVEAAVEAATDALGTVRHAVLGPCIRACCYEFGEADLDAVAARAGDAVRARTTGGRPALDLPAGVRAALGGSVPASVPVLDVGVCTSCSPDWFSHRRDGVTGRQGLLVTRRG